MSCWRRSRFSAIRAARGATKARKRSNKKRRRAITVATAYHDGLFLARRATVRGRVVGRGGGRGSGAAIPTSPSANPEQIQLTDGVFAPHRECLDHVIVLGERHLGGILKSYFAYYHRSRTHLSLRKDTPDLRQAHPPAMGEIVARPEVGGLHHRYERLAA